MQIIKRINRNSGRGTFTKEHARDDRYHLEGGEAGDSSEGTWITLLSDKKGTQKYCKGKDP